MERRKFKPDLPYKSQFRRILTDLWILYLIQRDLKAVYKLAAYKCSVL